MAFCWNIAQQLSPNGKGEETGAEKTVTGDDIAFMSFPSEDGNSKLQADSLKHGPPRGAGAGPASGNLIVVTQVGRNKRKAR